MRSRVDPYEIFSRVYDQDVHLDLPRAFFRTLQPLLRAARGAAPVLDLGCGSGLLTERIARAGVKVLGVDGSRPMLRRARARCAKHGDRARFTASDLSALHLPSIHTLAVACHDVLNHMSSQRVLCRVLRSVRSALAPGGSFVFDALTDWAFEHYWPDNTHCLEGPYGDLWMDCDYDPARRRGTVQMTAYVKGARGHYTRHETTLHEYAYRDRELTRALRSAGFAEVWRMPWSPWPSPPDGAQPERALWCGRLAGEGSVSPRLLRETGWVLKRR